MPFRVRWQDLKDLFRKAGTVLRADVSLGPDNRSRGYGTVLLATAEDAGRAVDMFHGYTWQSRVLEVRHDRLMPDYEGDIMIYPQSTGGVSAMGKGPGSTGSGGPHSLNIGGSVSGANPGIQGSGLGSRFASGSSTTGLGPHFGSVSTQGINNTSKIGPFNSSTPLSSSFPTSVPVPSSRPSSSSAVHGSDFSSQSAGANFQHPDSTANKTLFIGNVNFVIVVQTQQFIRFYSSLSIFNGKTSKTFSDKRVALFSVRTSP